MELFLDTGPETPFCKFNYLLEIVLADPGKDVRGIGESVHGYVKVNLYGDKGGLEEYKLTPEQVFEDEVVSNMEKPTSI